MRPRAVRQRDRPNPPRGAPAKGVRNTDTSSSSTAPCRSGGSFTKSRRRGSRTQGVRSFVRQPLEGARDLELLTGLPVHPLHQEALSPIVRPPLQQEQQGDTLQADLAPVGEVHDDVL